MHEQWYTRSGSSSTPWGEFYRAACKGFSVHAREGPPGMGRGLLVPWGVRCVVCDQSRLPRFPGVLTGVGEHVPSGSVRGELKIDLNSVQYGVKCVL